ncbi:uracil phosphoribosyltransferase-domain-containing protein [Globomyces pollinis-pini]|nr:uracil phosphoribosyltransferase-domain-containing protein [Globomyces pollinis-pini]
MDIKVISHPLYLHKLSLLRDERVRPKQFRELVTELSNIIGITATESLDLTTVKTLNSPIGKFTGVKIKDKVGVFPIMRAGNGMVDAFLNLVPAARVHHLGLFRDKKTLLPVEYYNKLPAACQLDIGFVLDPLIATAGTAIAAVNMLKDWGLKRIVFCSLLVSKSGVEALREAHPDIQIVTGFIDEDLTDKGYIYPGVGDAGDRLFKTFYD